MFDPHLSARGPKLPYAVMLHLCCRWATALAVTVAVVCSSHNPKMCTSAELAAPEAERLTAVAFQALDLLSWAVPPLTGHGLIGLRSGSPAADQCSTVLLFMQLSLGFVLPLLYQASQECQRWQQHQRQRCQCGLPLEGGWQRGLYGTVAAALRQDERYSALTLVVAVWLLSALLWELAVLMVPSLPSIAPYFV